MCGICGIVGNKIEQDQMHGMLMAIAHRGPDDEGVFQEKKIFLGHRRLSVLDTTTAGHQPMLYQNYVLVFNGEIYNYIELRKQLQALSHSFSTNTDTEVVLHAYAEWGMQAFSHFRGMWALALYDKTCRRLLLSRDRFGIKPLYYAIKNKHLVFASEIGAVLAGGIDPVPDMDVVLRYLVIGMDNNGRDTFFSGIQQLPGSYHMVFDIEQGTHELIRYYDLEKALHDSLEQSYEEEFLHTVQLHLRSDVKVGTCLSGGLDSSTVAAVAQQELQKVTHESLIAVTAKSENPKNDETDSAQMVVQHMGMEWKLAYPRYEDFVKYHLDMLHLQEEPVGGPSVFMQYWVMREAKEAGIKVILDGQGGDETLLGYERYYVSYLFQFLKQGELRRFVRAYLEIVTNSRLTMLSLGKYFFYFSYPALRKCVLRHRANFVKSQYLDRVLRKYPSYLSQKMDLRAMQIDEVLETQLPHLLKYEDRNSMGVSIESRVPFVDHVLLEKALQLPFAAKVKDGFTKYVLRKVAKQYLPTQIAWRKNKFGFEAPEDVWLKKYCGVMQTLVNQSNLLQQIVSDIPILNRLPLRLQWRLYNLAVWERQFFYGKDHGNAN